VREGELTTDEPPKVAESEPPSLRLFVRDLFQAAPRELRHHLRDIAVLLLGAGFAAFLITFAGGGVGAGLVSAVAASLLFAIAFALRNHQRRRANYRRWKSPEATRERERRAAIRRAELAAEKGQARLAAIQAEEERQRQGRDSLQLIAEAKKRLAKLRKQVVEHTGRGSSYTPGAPLMIDQHFWADLNVQLKIGTVLWPAGMPTTKVQNEPDLSSFNTRDLISLRWHDPEWVAENDRIRADRRLASRDEYRRVMHWIEHIHAVLEQQEIAASRDLKAAAEALRRLR
jgi:hypothetical protein